jgi:hypothetical protein
MRAAELLSRGQILAGLFTPSRSEKLIRDVATCHTRNAPIMFL